ncbi:CRISPR-associated endonuclease Cas3'' [Haloferax sp. Atlit-19N]|uniref:CRISPR-associated endonuclease Cas3'' n=1 Tax=Haloferax sp. Atlit-19N TaxID=2077201 RepID=UPI000E269838|nr:CRISPR-associated endonuclease Cas3'' [Haloferax sp. Atlit-19N]RDZ43420.1 CRISPR-associated endonuclease Cas3'' [Haloferax sp. Atlit-19N]
MTYPLISHPEANDGERTYPNEQLTDDGSLRLTAHNTVVSEYATRLFRGPETQRRLLCVAASLHDFGKATPQFQAYVRDEYDGPEKEKNHARLGALATWFVLGQLDAPTQDQLAATLAVARHHQALPNAAQYTCESLADAFKKSNSVLTAQAEAISEQWPHEATELLQLSGETDSTWDEFTEWVHSGAVVGELHEVSARRELTGPKANSDKLPRKLYDRTLHYWAAITLADKSHAMAVPESHVFDLETLDRETLEEYIADLRAEPPEDELERALNDERERARRQAISGVHEWLGGDTQAPPIATLTLPTGLGKTFTGLSAAFEAREMLESDDGPTRPIVYALPYTSIIEQTRSIFEKPELWGADPTKSALTVHHYLSETVVYHNERGTEDVASTDQEEHASFLGEAWRDGTVLTTFVQLFESLAGPANRQGLKLSALDDGLVILDEPQALPKEWWDGITRLIELLTTEYQARVIAMTATQPTLLRDVETTSILEAGKEHNKETCLRCETGPDYPVQLEPAAKKTYFENAERVRYLIDESALSFQLSSDKQYLSHETAAARVVEATAADEGGSTLAICNTISSSATLTQELCDYDGVTHLGEAIDSVLETDNVDATNPENDVSAIVDAILRKADLRGVDGELSHPAGTDIVVATLNSRYRPFDRQLLIEIADTLSGSEIPFALVSTQAIEAGVDLSFKRVFRDIAPLDSIVQAAGRCNRSYEWGRNGGQVVVWTLADPDEESPEDPTKSPPAHWVYERGSSDAGIQTHLRLISSILAQFDDEEVPDVEISHHAVNEYFEALREKSLSSTKIRTLIDDAKAGELARESLIGGYQTVDVLVATTQTEIEQLNELTELFTSPDPTDRSTGYKKLEQAAGIRVSLPLNSIEQLPDVSRIDGKERNEDGIQVFRYTGAESLEYNLQSGGLRGKEDTVAGRFTTF